ncbi:MAG: alpha/beta hydrolase [Clostridia bacterium]|nr:alpha/beta hydrolase [Clostridia bacterium]
MGFNHFALKTYLAFKELPYNRNTRYGEVTVGKGLKYSDGKHDSFDIYRLTGNNQPVLINFHGGALIGRKRQGRKAFCIDIAREGFCVINVNYRHNARFGAEATIENAYKIIGFVLNNASALSLDTQNIFISGDETGAFLGGHIVAKALKNNVKIKGFIGLSGLYDLLRHTKENNKFSTQFELMHKFFDVDLRVVNPAQKQHLKELSVTYHVSDDFPPVFIAHSEYDEFTPEQGDAIAKALTNHNVTLWEFKAVEERCSNNWHLNGKLPQAQSCLNFLKEYLNAVLSGKNIKNEYREI